MFYANPTFHSGSFPFRGRKSRRRSPGGAPDDAASIKSASIGADSASMTEEERRKLEREMEREEKLNAHQYYGEMEGREMALWL